MEIWSFETETYRKRPGLVSPPLVCGSIATRELGSDRLIDNARACQFFTNAISNPDLHLVGANLPYDLGVMAADNPWLIDPIFDALEAGRLHDVAIREALMDIAKGLHGVDPTTGRKLDDDEGARYPLALLVKHYMGLDISEDKKNPLAWRLRYGELDGIPVKCWPVEAVEYPKRDARHTIDVYFKQEEEARGVTNGGNLHAEPDQMRAAFVLHR